MARLTKRTSGGGVSIDWTDVALEKLAEYEDVDDSPRIVQDMKDFYDMIISLPNCNDCANRECGYLPRPGYSVRWNCPLWKDEDEPREILAEKEGEGWARPC